MKEELGGVRKTPQQQEEMGLEALEKEINTPALRELIRPVKEILEKLNLEQEDYQLIIGEAVSGRIPAEIFKGIIDVVHAKKKSAGSSPELIILDSGFVKDAKEENRANRRVIEQELQGKLSTDELDRPVLLVTDTISSGNSVMMFVRVFEKLEIPFTVVTIGLEDTYRLRTWDSVQEKIEDAGGYVVYGMEQTPEIWNPKNKHLSQVASSVGDVTPTVYELEGGTKKDIAKIVSYFGAHY